MERGIAELDVDGGDPLEVMADIPSRRSCPCRRAAASPSRRRTGRHGRSSTWRRRPPWPARRRSSEAEAEPCMVIEIACSSAMNMSTMRCCSTWNEPIGAPNCLRGLVYSSVPSFSRPSRRRPRRRARRSPVAAGSEQRQRLALLAEQRSARTARSRSTISAARRPSIVRKLCRSRLAASAIDHEQTDAAAIAAMRRGAGGDDQVIRPGRAR